MNEIKENKDKTIQYEPLSNFIYGIVDRDNNNNEPRVNIEVFKRYAVGNYVFNFIYVFLCWDFLNVETVLMVGDKNSKDIRIIYFI